MCSVLEIDTCADLFLVIQLVATFIAKMRRTMGQTQVVMIYYTAVEKLEREEINTEPLALREPGLRHRKVLGNSSTTHDA